MRKDGVRSEATDYELLIMNEQLFSVYIVCNVIWEERKKSRECECHWCPVANDSRLIPCS